MRRCLPLVALLALAPSAAAETRIGADAGGFHPAEAVAGPWESVAWRWGADETHGVAPDDGGPAWCAPTTGGCSRIFREAGEHRYHCPLHPQMRGVLRIVPESGDAMAPLRARFAWQADGLRVGFDASASAASGTAIERYEWDFGDNRTGLGRIVEHEYAEPGRYQATLTVVDESGRARSFSRHVVAARPPDPLADFRWNATGRSVAFESQPAGATHRWDLGDGTLLACDAMCRGASNRTIVSTPTFLVHVYARGGTFHVTHEIGDANGTRKEVRVVTVDGEETFDVRAEGLTLHVDASALPRYGDATFSWLFGDLTRADGPRASHTFPQEGLWSVDLTLVDDAGAQRLLREVPLVQAPPAPDVAPSPPPPTRAHAPTPGVALLLLGVALAMLVSERYK